MWRTGPREGFEAYGRLDSRPFTGWKLNPYTEASFTLADSKIEQGFNEDGESRRRQLYPRSAARVRLSHRRYREHGGLERQRELDLPRRVLHRRRQHALWRRSGRRRRRGAERLAVGGAGELHPNTNAVLFVSSENLTDKLYITDREDGIKPGIGRTVMAGAKVRCSQGSPPLATAGAMGMSGPSPFSFWQTACSG